jgi:RimJ/RimL family protein N-acetyltransferase
LTHAVGTLLHRALDGVDEGGLSLRRIQWFTNSSNVKSQTSSLRLGFTFEGLLRGHRIQPLGKAGVHGTYLPSLQGVGGVMLI